MSIPSSITPLFSTGSSAAAGGYQIERSLRFNSSDSAYCGRTFGTATSRRTWTWAGWVKRAKLSEYVRLFNNTASGNAAIQFMDSDKLRFFDTGISLDIQTTQVFRDASAWYHFVIVLDTVQGTSSNRAKIYVNGVQITTFSTSTYPSQNADGAINNNNAHQIGSLGGSSEFFNGYLADIHFIDGQALDATAFTEVSATTGQLIPKTYAGTYTGNSFWLKFNDNSAATATTLGKDSFLLGNNWTPNNLSVTAGAGNDSLVDTPTSYGTDTGVGGEVRGNYATLNPLFVNAAVATLSNGNLDYTTSSGSYAARFATIGVSSGKWYAEFLFTTVSGGQLIGIANNPPSSITFIGDSASGYSYAQGGQKYTNGSDTAYGASYTNGDIIGIAFDADAGTLVFYKNGSSQGTAFSSIAAGSYFFGISGQNGTTGSWNFGQRAFAYQTPGTNRPAATFKALCDTNLGAPLVALPNTVMDVKLYTGNGSTQTISGLNFSPDWVWIKSRSAATGHKWIDSVRGATFALAPTGILTTDVNGLTAFTSDGFLLGTDTNYNNTSATYVAWCWDTGGTTTTETSPGTVSVDRRANVSAGFSIAKFTSAASGNFSIAHGLGVAPSFVMISASTTYHASVCTTVNNYFNFGTTQALNTYSTIWGAALPTSSVVSMTVGGAVGANAACVAYCFAPVVGYSSFGSYTANGSADGPFVYTGFRPRWLMIKVTNISGESWVMKDAVRNTYNPVEANFYADLSAAEQTSNSARYIDFTSNGFKLRGTEVSVNGSANTYVYMCFAENPFQYSRAR